MGDYEHKGSGFDSLRNHASEEWSCATLVWQPIRSDYSVQRNFDLSVGETM